MTNNEVYDQGMPGGPSEDHTLHGYRLADLDRASSSLEVYAQLDGKGPLGALIEVLRQNQVATVLDGGAGTGRQLWDLTTHARSQIGEQGRSCKIKGYAVSDEDFSARSSDIRVVEAIRMGRIKYLLADLAMFGLPDIAADVAYSHEVLVHNRARPQNIVMNLWRSVGRCGVLYFNADTDQVEDIEPAIRFIKANGGTVTSQEAELSVREQLGQLMGTRPVQSRMIYKIVNQGDEDSWIDNILRAHLS